MKHVLLLLFSVLYLYPSASHKTIQRYPGGPYETIICIAGGNNPPKNKKKRELFGYEEVRPDEQGIVDRIKLRRAQRIDLTPELNSYHNEREKCQKEQLEV